MEAKAEMGELALFLIGALLSLLLLAVLFFPFVTRFRVRTRAVVRGARLAALVPALGQALARAEFSVSARTDEDERGPVSARFELAKGPNRFLLELGVEAEAVVLLITQVGLSALEAERLTVLTGTPLAWCALRVDAALRRAGLTPRWRHPEGAADDLADRPVPALKRAVVALSPWH